LPAAPVNASLAAAQAINRIRPCEHMLLPGPVTAKSTERENQ
jgi:hypothetical protein